MIAKQILLQDFISPWAKGGSEGAMKAEIPIPVNPQNVNFLENLGHRGTHDVSHISARYFFGNQGIEHLYFTKLHHTYLLYNFDPIPNFLINSKRRHSVNTF